MKARTQRLPTGGAIFHLPSVEAFQVLWIGRGSGLFLAQAFVPGGFTSRINHPSADGTYDTLTDAQRAVDNFVASVQPELDLAKEAGL